MKRLTRKYGNGMKYYNMAPGESTIDRLAEIEDILGDNYDLSHLRELVQADREGRCVVLPARIGGKVYRIEYVKDGNTYEIGIGSHVFDYLLFATERKNIGKTVFFTREAAEAALKEREQDERKEM